MYLRLPARPAPPRSERLSGVRAVAVHTLHAGLLLGIVGREGQRGRVHQATPMLPRWQQAVLQGLLPLGSDWLEKPQVGGAQPAGCSSSSYPCVSASCTGCERHHLHHGPPAAGAREQVWRAGCVCRICRPITGSWWCWVVPAALGQRVVACGDCRQHVAGDAVNMQTSKRPPYPAQHATQHGGMGGVNMLSSAAGGQREQWGGWLLRAGGTRSRATLVGRP
jgi:hypothetical protein